jgi:hypothetical protein
VSAASITRAMMMAIALMMEATSISETSVNFYQNTWHNNPENSHLHTRRRENLKSHKDFFEIVLFLMTLRCIHNTVTFGK